MHRSARPVASVVAALVLTGCAAQSGVSTTSPSAPDTTPSAEPSPVSYGGASAVIPLARGPRGVAYVDGSVWVASTIGNELQRIDPGTNRVSARVDAGARPVTLVIANGRLWVSVLNDDPTSDDELVRIDTTTNAVDLRATLPVHHNVAVGDGAIWVQDSTGHLRRVDAETAAVSDAAAVGIGPVALAANSTAVFGIRGSGAVWRFEVDSGELLEIDLGYGAPGRSRIAATDDAVIVAVPGLVAALDPGTLELLTQLKLPEMTLVNDLYAEGGDAWLSANVSSEELDLDGGSVLLLDPTTLEVRHTWRLGPESSGVVPAEESLWAVDQSDDVLARYPLDDVAHGG